MSTTITSGITDGATVLTSRLKSVRATTTKPYVQVRVEAPGETYYEERMSAYNGEVVIDDFGELVRQILLERGKMYDTIYLTIDDIKITFIAIACDYDLPTGFDPEECFLTAADSSLVHSNATISLSHCYNTNDYVLQVVGFNEGGELCATTPLTIENNSDTLTLAVADVIKYAKDETDKESGVILERVTHFAISMGSAHKVYYISESPFFLRFEFRNMFFALETIDIPCKWTRKTDVNRDLSISNGIATQYDYNISKVYDVETGPLSVDQMRELEQLAASRQVSILTGCNKYSVIITDHTIEYSNDDDTLQTAKFTFRFADKMPRLFEVEAPKSLKAPADEVFSQEFSNEYL